MCHWALFATALSCYHVPSIHGFCTPLATRRSYQQREWNKFSTPRSYHQPKHFSRMKAFHTRRFASGSHQDDNSSSNNDSHPAGIKEKGKHDLLSSRQRILAQNPEPEDVPIVTATLDWLEGVVIGMNLCPFAERPFKTQRLGVQVIHGRDETEILSQVLAECLVRQKQRGTCLIVCPDLYPTNFETFLQVYNMLNEGVLLDYNLLEDIQIAPFHPLFEFDGSGSDGSDNFTNRSPYPIFHILREEEVGEAVDQLDGDASMVWRRNVELMEALGDEFGEGMLRRILSGDMSRIDPTTSSRVREIVKAVRKTTL